MSEKLYKIFLIKSIDNEMQFYGHSLFKLNSILNNYYHLYKNYKIDNIKNKYITSHDIFEKYSFDDIEIILMEECDKNNIINNKIKYINNNRNCINKRYSSGDNITEIKLKYKNSKNKWKNNHKDEISDYNKNYYHNNLEKSKDYYQKIKDKLYEKSVCKCGKLVSFNRKASRVLHDNTNYHQEYIKSLK